MYCPSCGHKLAEDVRFCGDCGAPAPAASGNESVSLTKASTSGSRFDFKTFAAIIMAVGLLVCVGGGAKFLDNLPLAYPDQAAKPSPPAKSSTSAPGHMSVDEFWKSGAHPLAQMAKRTQVHMENLGREEERRKAYGIMSTGMLIFGAGAVIRVSIKKNKAGQS